jgi:hypothetical protein
MASILGVEIPDSRPVFLAVLAVHVLAGGTAVICGATAALARKRPGRHPRAGRIYLSALGVVFATAAAMTVLRWPHNLHLLAIGTVAFIAGLAGWRARRRRRPGWARRHLLGMGASYVTLLTGFYVDNGPQLPVWRLLPDWSFWFLPTAVATPIVARALLRYRTPPPEPQVRSDSRRGRIA